VEDAKRGIAQPDCLLEHRVEHRGEVARRGIDDLQYFGSRGLLLQCLARLGDQPRILHRDDRLRREIFDERDFLLRERPNFPAAGGNHAEQHTVFAERHIKARAYPGVFNGRLDHGMVNPCQIGDVDEAFAVDQRSGERVVDAAVAVSQLLCEPSRIGVRRHRAENFAFTQD
jgi:hypothetical protein